MHVVALVCVCCDFPSPIAATVEGLIYILLTRLRCCCKAAFHHMPRMVWCKGLIKGGEWRRICLHSQVSTIKLFLLYLWLASTHAVNHRKVTCSTVPGFNAQQQHAPETQLRSLQEFTVMSPNPPMQISTTLQDCRVLSANLHGELYNRQHHLIATMVSMSMGVTMLLVQFHMLTLVWNRASNVLLR